MTDVASHHLGQSVVRDAKIAVHNGNAGLRRAIWQGTTR